MELYIFWLLSRSDSQHSFLFWGWIITMCRIWSSSYYLGSWY